MTAGCIYTVPDSVGCTVVLKKHGDSSRTDTMLPSEFDRVTRQQLANLLRAHANFVTPGGAGEPERVLSWRYLSMYMEALAVALNRFHFEPKVRSSAVALLLALKSAFEVYGRQAQSMGDAYDESTKQDRPESAGESGTPPVDPGQDSSHQSERCASGFGPTIGGRVPTV
jgi:hypothetical protein